MNSSKIIHVIFGACIMLLFIFFLFIGIGTLTTILDCPTTYHEVKVPVKQECPKLNVAKECVNLLNDADTIKRLAEVKNGES